MRCTGNANHITDNFATAPHRVRMRKLVALLFVAVSAFAEAPARETSGDVSIVMPEGWVRIPVAVAMETKFDTKFADPQYKRRDYDPQAIPILVIQKIPKNEDAAPTDLGASIVIGRMTLPPVEISLREIAENLANASPNAFESVVIEKPLTETKIGGEQGFVIRYRYNAIKADESRMAARTALAMVKNDAYLYVIGYSGPVSGDEDGSSAFEPVVNSIEFAKRP